MKYVFTARPQQHPDKILCHYINATSKIQVIKIQDPHYFSFERVVFPGQRLFFEALYTDQLEVFSGGIASAILADTLPCSTLQIEAEPIDEPSVRPMELPLNAN
jgi:hypothetical protein